MEEENKGGTCTACSTGSGEHTCGMSAPAGGDTSAEGEKKVCEGCGHEHGADGKCSDNTCNCG